MLDNERVATVRPIPDGYLVEDRKREHRDGTQYDVFCVSPKEEPYDTDRAIYGSEKLTRESAIIAFNDEIRDVSLEAGWLPGLLKKVTDRSNLTSALAAKGYDALVIRDAETGEVGEVVVCDDTKIVRTEAVRKTDGQIRSLRERFVPTAIAREVVSLAEPMALIQGSNEQGSIGC